MVFLGREGSSSLACSVQIEIEGAKRGEAGGGGLFSAKESWFSLSWFSRSLKGRRFAIKEATDFREKAGSLSSSRNGDSALEEMFRRIWCMFYVM